MKLHSIAALFVVPAAPGPRKDVVKEILTVPELVQEDAAKKNEDNVPSKADMLSRSHCADLQGRGFCMFSVIDNKYCPTTCHCHNILPELGCIIIKQRNECNKFAEHCQLTCGTCGCLKIAPGTESKATPDARTTASSLHDSNHAPQQGRLNLQPHGPKQGSRAARNAKAGERPQADLGKATKATGAATQGRSRSNQWAASHRPQHSPDGKTSKVHEGGKAPPGNTKSEETTVKHDTKPATTARHARPAVAKHNNHPSMRPEPHGCK